jgi:hypothetical protein
MEIGWTDVGSGGYILVSCAHSNTSYIPKSSNQNAVFIGYDILIGRFSSMNAKFVLKIFAFLHYAGFIHGHRTSGYIRKFGGKLCNPLDIHSRQEKILSLVYCLLIIRKDMDTGGNHRPGTSH